MVKIEIEVPDNIAKFIEALQDWQGDDVDVPEYIRRALKTSCEADLDYLYEGAPAKANRLVKTLDLKEIVTSPWCYPCLNAKGARS